MGAPEVEVIVVLRALDVLHGALSARPFDEPFEDLELNMFQILWWLPGLGGAEEDKTGAS